MTGRGGGAATAGGAAGGREDGEAIGQETFSPQDPSSPQDLQEQEGSIEHSTPTSSHDQVVVTLEEQQQHQLDLSDYHGSNDPSPHNAAASSSHITIAAMGDTSEMTERTGKDSGFREQAFRLCSGFHEDSLDVEAGFSGGEGGGGGGGHTQPSVSSGHAAISSSTTSTHKDIPTLDLSDHSTSDVEELPPRQTTMRDLKGKAPCRE